MPSALGYHLPILRGVAERLGLETVAQMAKKPGVQAVYRVTVHYFDARASDTVTTLRRSVMDGITLEVYFQRALGGKPLVLPITLERYEAFGKALQSVGFDRMGDQLNIPDYNTTDVWMVERGSGTFVHGVVVAPELAVDSHGRLVNAVKNGLPEALRMIR